MRCFVRLVEPQCTLSILLSWKWQNSGIKMFPWTNRVRQGPTVHLLAPGQVSCIFSSPIFPIAFAADVSVLKITKKSASTVQTWGTSGTSFQCGIIKATSVVFSSLQDLRRLRVFSLSYLLDLLSNVCVHGWTGDAFYSLALLMLLEIRMLTHSSIWLHRSTPWHCNRINVNDVRYKPCSSLYPFHLPFYICFPVSVDLNLNNQPSSQLF